MPRYRRAGSELSDYDGGVRNTIIAVVIILVAIGIGVAGVAASGPPTLYGPPGARFVAHFPIMAEAETVSSTGDLIDGMRIADAGRYLAESHSSSAASDYQVEAVRVADSTPAGMAAILARFALSSLRELRVPLVESSVQGVVTFRGEKQESAAAARVGHDKTGPTWAGVMAVVDGPRLYSVIAVAPRHAEVTGFLDSFVPVAGAS